MDKYKCENCGAEFLECDLLRTKCSENFVGVYFDDICQVCIKKRKPCLSKLKKA